MSAAHSLNNGVYEGCATTNIAMSDYAAGSNIIVNCSVSLTQSVTCTNTSGNGLLTVPQQVVERCNKALSDRAFHTNLKIG